MSEIIVFPEPKEILFKGGNVVLDGEYKIVYDDGADQLEIEAAINVAKK
jgi:phosphomevalonate kinase